MDNTINTLMSPEIKYLPPSPHGFSEYEEIEIVSTTERNIESRKDSKEKLAASMSSSSDSDCELTIFEGASTTETVAKERHCRDVNDCNEKSSDVQIPKFSTAVDLCSALMKDSAVNIGFVKCGLCYRNFATPGELKTHKKLAHMIPKFKYTCRLCKKQFTHHCFHKTHMETYHQNIEKCFPDQDGSHKDCSEMELHLEDHKEIKDVNPVATYLIKCRFCDTVFEQDKYIEQLRIHLMEHHSKTKEGAAAAFNTEYLKKIESQATTSKKNDNPCKFCKRRFNTEEECYIHILYEHRGVSSCKVCKRSAYTEDMFLEHIKDTGHDLTRCSFCTKKVKSLEILVDHWDEVHDEIGRYPFFCEVCCYRFVTITQLYSHYDSHLLPLPYRSKDVEMTSLSKQLEVQTRVQSSRRSSENGSTLEKKNSSLASRNKMLPAKMMDQDRTEKKLFSVQCDECIKRLASTRGLKTHKKRVHNKKLPNILKMANSECKKFREDKNVSLPQF